MIKIGQQLRCIHSRFTAQSRAILLDFFYPVIIQRWAEKKTHCHWIRFLLLLQNNIFLYRLYLGIINFKCLSLWLTLPSEHWAMLFFQISNQSQRMYRVVYVCANHIVYLGTFQWVLIDVISIIWLIDFPNNNWDPMKFETDTFFAVITNYFENEKRKKHTQTD